MGHHWWGRRRSREFEVIVPGVGVAHAALNRHGGNFYIAPQTGVVGTTTTTVVQQQPGYAPQYVQPVAVQQAGYPVQYGYAPQYVQYGAPAQQVVYAAAPVYGPPVVAVEFGRRHHHHHRFW